MRARHVLAVSIVLALGCQAGSPTRPAGPARPKASAAIDAKTGVPGEATRVFDPASLEGGSQRPVAVELIGKIRLLSDHGGALIGKIRGGNILSNNGGTLIGKIRGDGANLIGKIRYSLGQTPAGPAEDLLADAAIEVLDAEGRVLVDRAGKPIGAVSDQAGGYRLSAALPDESLVLRVTLAEAGLLEGGQLLAMLARGGEPRRELDIDTASSLGASFVLDQYVQQRQGVFDRLPAGEAEALRRDLEAAGGRLAEVPSYRPADLVAAAERLRREDGPVAQTLERIRALLLAGQENLGRGRLATEVSLALPAGVVGDAAGNLFVVEAAAFRIRKIEPDGRIYVHAGTGARRAAAIADETLDAIGGATLAADGTIYLTQSFSNRLRRIGPDGAVSTLISEGLRWPGPLLGTSESGFVVGEAPSTAPINGRVLAIEPGRAPRDLGYRGAIPGRGTSIACLARAADGTLYVADCEQKSLSVRRPDGAWSVLASNLRLDRTSGLALAPDGSCYLAETQAHRVVRIFPDGRLEPAVGDGAGGHGGDGGPARAARVNYPGGLWLAPDGALFLTDGDGLVRKVAADGTITRVAGSLQTSSGDALGVSINSPGGLALDASGRLIISEASSSTIKRLDGGRLEVVGGTSGVKGLSGDGGPATLAQLANPAGLAFADGSLYFAEPGNNRLRRIDAAGIVTTIAQDVTHTRTPTGARGPFPAQAVPMTTPLMVAVSPRGQVYWSDPKAALVMRLAGDRVEVVAGAFATEGSEGDGGPANQALLNAPLGLAFDPAGDLYVCDSGNLIVRKIAGGEPTGTITRVAGVPAIEAVTRFVAAGGRLEEEGVPALEAALAAPTVLCFDDAGGMIVAELGTSLSGLGYSPEAAALMAQLPPLGARLRRVAPDGTIRTIAGEGARLLADPSTDDTLIYPLAMLIDREGRLIVADAALNQVKMLPRGSF